MEITLNEYLAEVDRWKQGVSDRMAVLDPIQRAKADQDALAWLEHTLGRRLEVETIRRNEQAQTIVARS